MNTSFWSLLYLPTMEEKTFAQWGIAPDAQRSRQSLATDTFTFTVLDLPFDSEPPFAHTETCIIKRNGVRFFHGRVTGITMAASGNSESMRYTLSGPWWYLDQLVYQQLWNLADDATLVAPTLEARLRSRSILFIELKETVVGSFVFNLQTAITVTEQVLKAVNYCISGGAPFAVGMIDPGAFKPQASEIRDVTCGEIVRSCLKFTPDCVSWFDYSTDPPKLNIRPRASLVAKSLPLAGAPTSGLTITPRYDLLVSGVKILYESVNSINEFSWTVVNADTAGTPDGFQSVVCTTELGGSSLTVQTQRLSIAKVDVTARPFWESVLPWLKQATSVTISDVRMNNALVLGQTADTNDTTSSYDKIGTKDFSTTELTWTGPPPTNLQNVLSAGQVPHWLKDDFEDVVATAKINYTLENPEHKSKEVKVKAPFYAKMKRTELDDGENREFQNITTLTPAEPQPVGVAAAYYAATSILHYEGDYQRTEEELSGDVGPGNTLDITGGPSEWSEMAAVVQTVSENLGNGQTSIRFGPPAHLSTQEFIEMLRVMRTRQPSRRMQEQLDGKSYGNGGQVDGANQVPQAAANPSVGHTKLQTVSTFDEGTGAQSKITLETG